MDGKKRNIIIADSNETRAQELQTLLSGAYNVIMVSDGEQLLKKVADYFKRLSAIILDADIPKISAEKVMDALRNKKITKYVPVLVMADRTSELTKMYYDKGAAAFLRPPYNTRSAKAKVDNVVNTYAERKWLEKKVIQQNRELTYQADMLRKLNDNILDMIGTIIEFRGIEDNNHIRRVKEYTLILGEAVATFFKEYQLDSEQVNYIASASSMHDIGKLLIPDSIVLKAGKLTADEFDIIKSHTTKGCEMLEAVSRYQEEVYYRYSYEICRYHHERYDGSGYPEGLTGDEIPISAQIVSVTEAFDALMCDTVYRKAVGFDRACEMIVEGECGTFSPKLIQCFKVSQDKLKKIAVEYQG
ncbi:MAG: HD domain-containing protein [Lachnospiraceae bacterium]|nr:HD domain-containing protein [Lachnospiraceae bacterium]